jgi:hypothetical protein
LVGEDPDDVELGVRVVEGPDERDPLADLPVVLLHEPDADQRAVFVSLNFL